MCLTLLWGQILCPRSSSHSISSLRPGNNFHQIISESSSLQTERIRLLLEDLLKALKLSIGWLFQRFNEVQIKSSTNDNSPYLLNPFLLATALTNEISSFLYINQFGSISTSFWRYPLKSVRWKALGWISYFTPSSSSVPPNVFTSTSQKNNFWACFGILFLGDTL